MVETRRETFTVTPVGVGQPDYAQVVTPPPSATSLVVKFPEREIAGKKYDDYAAITLTTAAQEYVVGTNANNAKSGSWPSGIVARAIAFFATVDSWVRFNDVSAVAHFIPAGLSIRFEKRTEKVYVYQDSGAGTLHMWIEG